MHGIYFFPPFTFYNSDIFPLFPQVLSSIPCAFYESSPAASLSSFSRIPFFWVLGSFANLSFCMHFCSKFFQLCKISRAKWDSIVLLDEADIFLEQRCRQNIFCNVMVGVSLKLLEYHNSTTFLTMDCVFTFDPAIRSRISIAIKYRPLKRLTKKRVWQQLLDMINAKISETDLNEVCRL
jgi:hypothetical protein